MRMMSVNQLDTEPYIQVWLEHMTIQVSSCKYKKKL